MASHDPSIRYDYTDYLEAHWDKCQVVVASARTIALCLSALRSAEWYSTRWYDGDDILTSGSKYWDVVGWYNTAIKELIMSCDIEADIKRIADALEAIQAVVEGTIQVSPQNGYLKPYVDQIEEVLQEQARALGGVTIPVDEVP